MKYSVIGDWIRNVREWIRADMNSSDPLVSSILFIMFLFIFIVLAAGVCDEVF